MPAPTTTQTTLTREQRTRLRLQYINKHAATALRAVVAEAERLFPDAERIDVRPGRAYKVKPATFYKARPEIVRRLVALPELRGLPQRELRRRMGAEVVRLFGEHAALRHKDWTDPLTQHEKAAAAALVKGWPYDADRHQSLQDFVTLIQSGQPSAEGGSLPYLECTDGQRASCPGPDAVCIGVERRSIKRKGKASSFVIVWEGRERGLRTVLSGLGIGWEDFISLYAAAQARAGEAASQRQRQQADDDTAEELSFVTDAVPIQRSGSREQVIPTSLAECRALREAERQRGWSRKCSPPLADGGREQSGEPGSDDSPITEEDEAAAMIGLDLSDDGDPLK
ncbi:hypothetical protein D9M72_379110 [compost metagenome]